MTSALKDSGSTRLWRQIRGFILRRDDWTCRYCGQPANHVHHVTPRDQGGTDAEGNLVAACQDCNLAIGNSFRQPPPRTPTPMSSLPPGTPPFSKPPQTRS